MELDLHEWPEEVVRAKQRYGIIGNSPALMEAVGRAVRVAPIDLSVLVTGESGTGKEFFPKIIHGYSPRKHAKYIAVNCGAIPEGTIDSELFGHEKGAFTGAVASRKGYFEEADGGTLFLDEVAELPLTTQARLLRVLESGEFIKVGSSTVQHTNVRIVAATNVDMAKAIAEGRFREDLYYRLSTVSISVPPLRERGSDIALLARKFAADFAERYTMPRISFDDEARALLLAYRWPGNVRQLKNVVEQLALFYAGDLITAELLRPYLPAATTMLAPVAAPGVHTGAHDYDAEREMLLTMIVNLRSQVEALNEKVERLSRGTASGLPFVETVEQVDNPGDGVTRSLVKFEPFASTLSPREIRPAESEPTTLEETERETIRRSLERNGGRRKATAAELNISERTLYRKIKEYGIE